MASSAKKAEQGGLMTSARRSTSPSRDGGQEPERREHLEGRRPGSASSASSPSTSASAAAAAAIISPQSLHSGESRGISGSHVAVAPPPTSKSSTSHELLAITGRRHGDVAQPADDASSGLLPRRRPSGTAASSAGPSSPRRQVPSSHSYPFLAEPPKRRYTRTLSRRSSMPPASSPSSSRPSGRLYAIPRPPTPPLHEQLTHDRQGQVESPSAPPAHANDDAVASVDGEVPGPSPSQTSHQDTHRLAKRRRTEGFTSLRKAASTALESPGAGRIRSLSTTSDRQRSPLGEEMTEVDRRYELVIVQSPTSGCAFGRNILGRIPCAPPLILRLQVTDARTGRELPSTVEEPWLFCHVNLFTVGGQQADLLAPQPTTRSSSQAGPTEVGREARAGEREPQGDSSGRVASQSTAETSVQGSAEGDQAESSATGAVRRSSRRLARSAAASGPSPPEPSRDPTGSETASVAKEAAAVVEAAGVQAASSSLQAEPSTSTHAQHSGGLDADPGDDQDVRSGRVEDSLPTHGVRMLYGSLVANPQVFRSPDGSLSTFFIFPEICIRARGSYRLRSTLMRLPRSGSAANIEAPSPSSSSGGGSALTSVMTEPFLVLLSREYVAPFVTDTTRYFARQGAALPLPAAERIADRPPSTD